MIKILESGSAASPGLFNASRGETAWQAFVAGVPSCAQTATSGHTLDCLKNANSSDIAQGVRASLNNTSGSFPFDPTLDGPDGLIPDLPSTLLEQGHFACVPFIAGTNLDEGGGDLSHHVFRLVLFHRRNILLTTSYQFFTTTL